MRWRTLRKSIDPHAASGLKDSAEQSRGSASGVALAFARARVATARQFNMNEFGAI